MLDPTAGMLTVKEVAALLRCHPKTVERMTARGELRVHRLGRAPRYLWSEVVADTRERIPTPGQALWAVGRRR